MDSRTGSFICVMDLWRAKEVSMVGLSRGVVKNCVNNVI